MNKHTSSPAPTWPMASEAVNFTNGMIVTAEDLKAAMLYPVQLMQAVNRAVYGCGVICGFEIRPDPGLCDKTEKICIAGKDEDLHRSFRVEVGRGTAMDCSGLPIELCKPILVDLSPDTCGCDPKEGGCVCIMIRRISAAEAPRGDCCGTASGPLECSRLRDHVEIRGFPADELPEHYCGRRIAINATDCGCVPVPEDDCGCGGKQKPSTAAPVPEHDEKSERCTCLKKCDDCCCCGKGWVLLARLQVTSHGIVKFYDKHDDNWYDNDHVRARKYVKPIECACLPEPCKPDMSGDEADETVFYTAADKRGRRDDYIEARLAEIIDASQHLNFFKTMGIRNLLHLEYVLEHRREILANQFVFKKNADKLEAYLERTKEMIEKYGLRER
jgi:hypothetical protein